jgi:hypothetical protein
MLLMSLYIALDAGRCLSAKQRLWLDLGFVLRLLVPKKPQDLQIMFKHNWPLCHSLRGVHASQIGEIASHCPLLTVYL